MQHLGALGPALPPSTVTAAPTSSSKIYHDLFLAEPQLHLSPSLTPFLHLFTYTQPARLPARGEASAPTRHFPDYETHPHQQNARVHGEASPLRDAN